MRNNITLVLVILLSTATAALYGQKVQYKKGEVYVNKKLAFEFEEIKNLTSKGKLKHYALIDLDGNTVFSMVDTTFYYDQLPNETTKRAVYEAYLCTAHGKGLQGIIPYVAVMSYPKQRIKDLQQAGFFKELAFNESIFQAFLDQQSQEFLEEILEEIEITNKSRMSNHALTKEKFGPLMKRNPVTPRVVINTKNSGSFIIEEENSIVANINLVDKGSTNHAYQVVNRAGDVIGEINIFQNPETVNGLQNYRYNLKAFILGTGNSEDNYKWFYERVKSTGSPESTTSRLETVAKYMVNEGLL
jgi:hypothetical protein